MGTQTFGAQGSLPLDERLRALIGATADVVYEMSADWAEMRVLNGNGLLFDTDAPRLTWLEDYVLPEDRLRIMAAVRQAIDTRAPYRLEHRVRRADGSVGWILSRAAPMIDDDGAVTGWLGMANDVTGQYTTNEALIRTEQRFHALFEAIDDGFCIIEFTDGPHGPLSDYVHVEANAGYERHSGIPDIVGQTVRMLAPDQADSWVELYGNVLRTGQPVRFERYFAQAGRHIEVSASRVEPASLRQVSVLFRDIDARKRAEEALRASEALARENIERVQLALSAGAILGTWFWNIPADRVTVDEAFAGAFGLDPALGREGVSLATIIETVHPDDVEGLTAAIAEAVQRGGAYAHQYRVRRSDGHYYWIEANGRADHGPDGKPLGFPGVLIDIQDRRLVEAERDRSVAALRALNETLEQRVAERTAELMRTEEQLRQAQKMEAVGQLTGGLAHDFNNLLGGISGAFEMIARRLDQGRAGDVGKYLLGGQGAVRRAAALTQRLLAFSRRQTLDPRPTDVNALVHGMADLVRRSVGPGIAVEIEGAADLGAALVDPGQLENALLNLCINARDAMPDGGRITIATGNHTFVGEDAAALDLEEGRYLTLQVTDTGTGMTPDVVAKAFDPFFTTKPLGEGTGLGLSMIYGFARQSGGQAKIESAPDRGASVSIHLPRHHGAAAAGDPDEEAGATALRGTGQTVLVVDDEATIRLLLVDVLEEQGYRVIEAGDSVAGLAILQSGARVDLLITDVGLPGGMNGRQMAEAGREARPGLKVLLITGYAQDDVFDESQPIPDMAVMGKPFVIETLALRVQEVMAG